MASIINASTSGAGGVITTADASGVLNIQTAGTTAISVDASQNVTFARPFAGNGPAFRAGQGSAQTITNNTWTKVSFATEVFDTNSNYDNSTNYRFTPSVAGYYQINVRVDVDGGAAGTITAVAIWKNGSETSVNFSLSASGQYNGSQVSDVIYMNGSTDYLEGYVLQNSGTSKSLVASTGTNTFSGAMVRAA